jgi:hypothetical protein
MNIMKRLNKQMLLQASNTLTRKSCIVSSLFKTITFDFSKKATFSPKPFYSQNKSNFASKLPSHQKCKMPTLSPTMNKVRL